MQRTTVLIISDAGAVRLMLSLREICERTRSEEFHVLEELLPAACDKALGSVLPRVFARTAPQVAVLCPSWQAVQQVEAVVRVMCENRCEIPLLLGLEHDGGEDLLTMLNLGVADFVIAPFRAGDVLARLRRLCQPLAGGAAVNEFKRKFGLEQFVGESRALIDAIQQVPKLARCDSGVFITGETGTGKEMFARAIHYLSPRASKPFIPVNCGAIPADLVENELFGHEPGAFTGATTSTRGLIHDADGGTLFLDEIDSMPPSTQVKLLRLLQDRVYRPLGSRKMLQADIRVIAASNADVAEAARSGRFRLDLFYRINVLPLALPPLRERRDDISLLARHFAVRQARELKTPAKEFSPAALQKLVCYDWPGNVRELENVIQRAVVLAEHPVVRAEDILLPGASGGAAAGSFKDLKAQMIAHFERTYLQRLLTVHEGNITHAARAANKNRRAFWQLLRKHNLQIPPPALHYERSCLDKMRLR